MYLIVRFNPGSNEPDILAYFSVAIDQLVIGDQVSSNMKRNLNGIFNDRIVPCYLIGQLARNDAYSRTDISGEKILNFALSVLMDAHDLVGGRFVRIDCKDIESLLKFYTDNGFTKLPDKYKEKLCQCIIFLR